VEENQEGQGRKHSIKTKQKVDNIDTDLLIFKPPKQAVRFTFSVEETTSKKLT
jgi:hypothetical protein